MVKEGEYFDFIKNLKTDDPEMGYSTDIRIMKELAEKIDILEARIIELEKATPTQK